MRKHLLLRRGGALLAAAALLAACTARSAPAVTDVPGAPAGATLAATPTDAGSPSTPPAELLARAIAQQENGDYEAAAAGLDALVESGAPVEVRREALLRAGHVELQAGAYAAAVTRLERFVRDYATDAAAPTAFFWLGEARLGLGDGQGAAAAYRSYLESRPLLASYVEERIGKALVQAGDQAGAADAFRAAANAESNTSSKAALIEDCAGSLAALKRYDEAVAAYEEALDLAQTTIGRAEIMFELGSTLRDAGRQGEAAARWNELVATYPLSSYAAQALATLDDWQAATVGAVTRAQVEYGAGRYQSALDILQAYVAADPQGHLGDAHYWAALADRKLGQHESAVAELDALITSHPQNDLIVEAWYEKAESQALAGLTDDAVATFRTLAEQYPQSARAVQALWRVAQLYDGEGRSEAASAAYATAAATYPGASYAADARFDAGLAYYVAGQPAVAAQVWAGYLDEERDPAMHARLLLWLGKAAERQGDMPGAQARWQEARLADPGGFWSLRARDLLAGRSFVGQAPAGAFEPAAYVPRGTPDEAERWLAAWAPALPAGQAPGRLPTSVADATAFQRGMEFWALGDAASAQAELRQVQTSCKDDPWALYALAVYYRDQGLYQPSILAAARLMALAPEQAGAVPRMIAELAYPTYYAGLVLSEAQATNTDPLLFFGLIYQESVFDRDATSYAGARGLTQVMPATGEYIAGKLGDTAYAPEKLWRPTVSVRYGLWYLSAALSMFNGDALTALVAYNAGPSNAANWAKAAGGDPDLFFEQVSNSQPRAYMQRIYEHVAHYVELYRR